ncbi:ATP-binding protein [Sphingosinicella terrae]|uniref:ATP-binding protein n=1 Tax=Sphingosinicella terrae TaxID=2172047 RepID=UPI000E0D1FCA|nr:ATP-binding protein [Sphingosinicella terrae]
MSRRQPTFTRWANVLIVTAALGISMLVWTTAARQIAFEREQAVRLAIAHNDDRALMLQQYVSRTLDTANMAALHVAALTASGSLRLGRADRPQRIEDRIALNPAFLGLSVVDSSGDVVATTLAGRELSSNVRAHPAFASHVARDTDGLFVSRPAYSRLLGDWTIWLSRRLNHADGSFAGVIAINMSPAQLTAIFGETAVKPSEVAWVVGLDGIMRSRRTGDRVSAGEDVSRGTIFRLQRSEQQGRHIGPGTLDGQNRLISHRRVPGYPLFVSHSILEDEVLRDARQRARYFIAGALLVTLAAIVVALLMRHALKMRERRAMALAVAKARLEEAQRVGGMGDWSYTFEDRKVIWSPQLYEMYERDPALGPLTEGFADLLADEGAEAMDASVRLVGAGDPTAWEMEVRLPSGRTVWHLVSAVPTRDAGGAVVGFHGTTQDVTARRKLEALQDQVAHLARIGEMNALTATLAHELNQPLAAARNYLSGAQRTAAKLGPDAQAIVEAMQEARRQVARVGEIIQRMRNLVTKNNSSRTVVSIDAILDEALAIVSLTRTCTSPIEVVKADQELLVEADAVQLQQVILNLVRNACEAQKGRDAPPPRIEVSVEGDRMVVCVVDHGPGFPDSLRGRLFQPLTSSKETGLGLGLSISRTIIEAHRGTLAAENRPTGGAVVSFALPLHDSRPRSQAA